MTTTGGPDQRVTTVDGRDVRWVSAGSGRPTVVLEAGLTASASEWTSILPRVASTTRVVAVSRAGYGGSTPVGRRTAHASVRDLAAVLEEVDGPLVLVGHSWGGMLARLYAAANPDRVQGLVVVDATHEDLAMMRTTAGRLLGQAGMTLASLMARAGKTRRDLEAGRGALGRPLQSLAGPLRQAVIDEFSAPQTWQQARRDHAAVAPLLREVHRSPLPDPPVPVVAVVGARGEGREAKVRATVVETYERWVRGLPDGRLVMAPRSGHLVPLDDEDLLVDVIGDLVAEIRAHRGGP